MLLYETFAYNIHEKYKKCQVRTITLKNRFYDRM